MEELKLKQHNSHKTKYKFDVIFNINKAVITIIAFASILHSIRKIFLNHNFRMHKKVSTIESFK